MRPSGAALGAGIVGCLLAASSLVMSPAAAAPGAGSAPVQALAVAPGVTAWFAMDEPVGSTVMTDGSGRGHDGAVDPTGVQTGATYDGATGYNWVRRPPEDPPASPERVVQIPDSIDLEPGSGPFTIEVRYRTKENFGNITQKGQAQSKGGQWKIQSPGGVPSCLFQGAAGQVATGSLTPLNDEQWHDLTCVLTSTGVTMYVDGVYRNKKNGTTGTIDNAIPMTVGGKINCDQVTITCDYFSGQIDFIKITKAANLSPTAAFTSSCAGLTCRFDSSTSTDIDGNVTRYAWTFGDGTTSTSASPLHTFTNAGPYDVSLTVTDNTSATGDRTNHLDVVDGSADSPVRYVASASVAANTNKPTVTVPAAAAVGDRLLLALSSNNLSSTFTAPTGVTGWTLLDTATANTMATTVWTKVVAPGDPGKSVSVPLSGVAKYTLTVADYTGTDPTSPVTFSRSVNTSTVSSRPTPVVTAPPGAWVVSYWADKSSTTTAWTPSSSVTSRSATCGADGGRICSALADSGGVVPAGSYGGITATTGTASAMATMWSVVLAPSGTAPSDQPPTAAFTSSCTFLDCWFDSTSSSDPDGAITDVSWTFGDGTSSSQASPPHTFPTSGTYPVVLTVTDDDGAHGTRTTMVTVTAQPGDSTVAFVGSAATSGNTKTPAATVPAATSAGDRLVLVLSLNNLSRTVSTPTGVTGWTLLDSVTAGSMGTTVWTKVAEAGDAGKAVTVPLDGVAKLTLSVAAYSGVTAGPLTWARATSVTSQPSRSTPVVTAPDGAWVISYWADKSSTTTAWTPSASVATRSAVCAADAGRICSALADSAGAVPPGPYGAVTASTNAPSDTATVWSIVLPPAP